MRSSIKLWKEHGSERQPEPGARYSSTKYYLRDLVQLNLILSFTSLKVVNKTTMSAGMYKENLTELWPMVEAQ